jgi:hypothetical protein
MLTLQFKTVRRERHMYLYLFYMGVPIAMGGLSVCSVLFMLDMQYAVMIWWCCEMLEPKKSEINYFWSSCRLFCIVYSCHIFFGIFAPSNNTKGQEECIYMNMFVINGQINSGLQLYKKEHRQQLVHKVADYTDSTAVDQLSTVISLSWAAD